MQPLKNVLQTAGKRTLVAVESGVALVAAALEGLLAGAVDAAGQAHAPRAVRTEPSQLARACVGGGAVALHAVGVMRIPSSFALQRSVFLIQL